MQVLALLIPVSSLLEDFQESILKMLKISERFNTFCQMILRVVEDNAIN